VINSSWSHFLISRHEIDELGYFDERLLGIGEEDGDMTWRYIQLYGKPLANVSIKGFVNYSEETVSNYAPQNIKARPGMKYSQFNRDFMFNVKYEKDPAGIKGMFDESVGLKNPGKEQYPNERFYREHKGEL
jgi:predicted glycosyltransferase involved in capsule biosynthesis